VGEDDVRSPQGDRDGATGLLTSSLTALALIP
jgi:hypothetical protein